MNDFKKWVAERQLREGWRDWAKNAALGTALLGNVPFSMPAAEVNNSIMDIGSAREATAIFNKDQRVVTVRFRGVNSFDPMKNKLENRKLADAYATRAILKGTGFRRGTIVGRQITSFAQRGPWVTATYVWSGVN